MNKLDEDVLPEIADVLRRTADDFGFTLTGNPIEAESVKTLQGVCDLLANVGIWFETFLSCCKPFVTSSQTL